MTVTTTPVSSGSLAVADCSMQAETRWCGRGPASRFADADGG